MSGEVWQRAVSVDADPRGDFGLTSSPRFVRCHSAGSLSLSAAKFLGGHACFAIGAGARVAGKKAGDGRLTPFDPAPPLVGFHSFPASGSPVACSVRF